MNIDNLSGKTFILNPYYVLRNDKDRSLIATADNTSFLTKDADLDVDDIISLIHPSYAVLLSFFNGKDNLNDTMDNIRRFFNLTQRKTLDIVSKFINNTDNLGVEFDNCFFYLPKHLIVEKREWMKPREYYPEQFDIYGPVNLYEKRLNAPIYLNLLVNNRCMTDCIYCYADKRQIMDCSIPFKRIRELISEARDIGISSFDIHGGELFLYPEWDKLLNSLYGAGYSVYISTKCPLSRNMIAKLADTGAKELQISLDSIFQEDLITNLRVSADYRDRMLETLENLARTDILLKVKAVITNPIFNIGHMKKYLEYFDRYPNVKVVELTAPSHSLYKTQKEFLNYRLKNNQLQQIMELAADEKDRHAYELRTDIPQKEAPGAINFDVKKRNFHRRSSCSGNMISCMILPNGDVTVCEETYFNQHLKLGNIISSSIMDVWNSEQARNLYYIPQTIFPKESPCSSCLEFKECRHNKGICWTDAMAAYGEDNWLFPTPDCPYSPKPVYDTEIWQS